MNISEKYIIWTYHINDVTSYCIICKTDFLCELPFLIVFYIVKAKNPRFSVTLVRRKIISKLVEINKIISPRKIRC